MIAARSAPRLWLDIFLTTQYSSTALQVPPIIGKNGFPKVNSTCFAPSTYIMSSNPTLSVATPKNVAAQTQNLSPSQSHPCSTLGLDNQPQRRSGGSSGAGSTSRTAPAIPRNNQSSRKQHKNQRRPRLADEDAAAESVSHAINHRPNAHESG